MWDIDRRLCSIQRSCALRKARRLRGRYSVVGGCATLGKRPTLPHTQQSITLHGTCFSDYQVSHNLSLNAVPTLRPPGFNLIVKLHLAAVPDSSHMQSR